MSFAPPWELKENTYSLMLNGNIQTSNGDFITLSSEASNLLCSRFKDGYKVCGTPNPVHSLGITFWFLANEAQGKSEIAVIKNTFNRDGQDLLTDCKDCNKQILLDVPLEKVDQTPSCDYTTFVNADCLGFSVEHPIKSWAKVDDCNTRLYFVQDNKPPRYIDYPDYQKQLWENSSGDIGCPHAETPNLDCGRIKIFKDACSPILTFIDVVSGGQNTAGTLQFGVQYSDAYGNAITNSFYFTNTIDIWDKSKTILLDQRTDYIVNKSVKLHIDGLNPNFDWFNLIVLKTVNNTTSPFLVETFSNTGTSFNYTYSGIDKNLKERLSIDQVLKRNPIYDTADIIAESNGILTLSNLTESRILNLQPVINKLNVLWETVQLDEGDYANPILANKYQSFLRDETYPLAIEFSMSNTNKTARFHIPGRSPSGFDLEDVTLLPSGKPNPDVFSSSSCDSPSGYNPRWKVYNTATNLGGACGGGNTGGDGGGSTTKITNSVCIGNDFYGDKGSNGADNSYNILYDGLCSPVEAYPHPQDCDKFSLNNHNCLQQILSSLTNPVITNVTIVTKIKKDGAGNPIPYTCPTPPHPVRYRWNQYCYYTISSDVPSPSTLCPDGSNIITATFDCNKSSFYQNPSGDTYFLTYSPSGCNSLADSLFDPIVDPCSYFNCNDIDSDCKTQIQLLYPTGNIVSNTCDIITTTFGDSFTCNIYSPSGLINVPPFPNPSGDPSNTFCDGALNPSPNCDSPTLVKLNDGELTWWSFIASTDAQQFNISSRYNQVNGHNFTLTLYSSNTGLCVDKIYVSTQVFSNPVFIFQNLTPGLTYFLSIEATSPVTMGTDNFYYICTFAPTPIGTTTIQRPNIVHVRCRYTIQYEVCVDKCNAKVWEYGNMAYWESTELYPCLPEVWGDLANTPIRHHKFPDCLTSPHFQNINHNLNLQDQDLFGVKNKIYPIGVRIDVEQLKGLLNEAVSLKLITHEERLSICGYRILRGNRRGNEGVIAKGLLYDVWKYTDNVYKTQKDILYPNYPYNDRNPDQFNLKNKLQTEGTPIVPITHPYKDFNYVNNKYTFIGANTLFNNPGLGSEVKLEMEMFGSSEGRFNEVINHAKYQYAGIGAVRTAFTFATLESLFDVIGEINAGGFISASILSPLASPLWGSKVPGHYYDWLDIIKKLAPFRNFAWYFTSIGNYTDFIPKSDPTNVIIEGNIRRSLNDAEYLIPGILTVNDGADRVKFNNYKRESSVYLDLNNISGNTTLTDPRDFFTSTYKVDESRWYPGDDVNSCKDLGYKYKNIDSYYASLKTDLPNQYGQVDQIDYVDTGYNGIIDWTKQQSTECSPVFGGDTFINRFSIRRQLPFFLQDRVGYPINSDVQYNELSNIGFPQFYFSYPNGVPLSNIVSAVDISQLFGDVAINNFDRRDYNFNCDEDTGQVWLNNAGKGAIAISRWIVSMNIIAGAGVANTVDQVKKTFNPLDPDHPFDNPHPEVYPNGKFFLYSYGEPSFIIESDYNIDLRYGINYKEGDFYPHISDMVTWTQPTKDFNMIDYDNTYNYNRDYSKQNKENLGYVLEPNFSQSKSDCKVSHPNRTIYSIQDIDNNDRFDGNRIFLANNYHDFSKGAGKLINLIGTSNNKVLVLQENQASVFNAYSTIEADIKAIAVGAGTLFNNNLQQYERTDLGFGGSQTTAYTATDYGIFYVDNKNGKIFKYTDRLENIIPQDEAMWFKENLPFHILNYFPNYPIDNPLNGAGMVITWDDKFKRVFFTKKDYAPKSEFINQIIYDGTNFRYKDLIIFPNDTSFFCNKSWTLSYCPLEPINSFISFHSFIPDFYNSLPGYFQSGINRENGASLWNHNLTNKSFGVYYSNFYPFIFEYSLKSKAVNQQLEDISWYAEARRWQDNFNYGVIPNATFDYGLIYNANATSGNLELIVKEKNNLYQWSQFNSGKVGNNKTQVLVENIGDKWSLNSFFDISRKNGLPIMQYPCNQVFMKEVNIDAISYTPKYISSQFRNDWYSIRLGNLSNSQYQFTNRIELSNEEPIQ